MFICMCVCVCLMHTIRDLGRASSDSKYVLCFPTLSMPSSVYSTFWELPVYNFLPKVLFWSLPLFYNKSNTDWYSKVIGALTIFITPLRHSYFCARISIHIMLPIISDDFSEFSLLTEGFHQILSEIGLSGIIVSPSWRFTG